VSLINKMLKDLETRQGGGAARAGRPVFQDLQSVTYDERRQARSLLIGALLVLALAAGGYFAWTHWASKSGATPATTATVVPHDNSPTVGGPTILPGNPSESAPMNTPAATASATPQPPESSASKSSPPAQAVAVVPKKSPTQTKPAGVKPDKPELARIEKTDRPYTPEEIAENAYRTAAQLYAQGRIPEAERQLKAVLAARPEHVKARESLATIQLEAGRWLEAQDTLEQGVARVPGYMPFRYQLARLYFEHGSESQAIELLERARREGHADAELPAFLAALYQRAGRHAEAVKNYREALALKPREGKWWVGFGIALESQQDTAAARDAYQHALESGGLSASLMRYAEDRSRALTVH